MKTLLRAVLLLLAAAPAFAANEGFNTFTLGLGASTTLAGTEDLVCVQGGVSTKCTPAQIDAYVAANLLLPCAGLPALTGPVTTSAGSCATSIAASGVTAGSYGAATMVGAFTVGSDGRITSASSVAITGTTPGGSAGGDLTGTYPNPTVAVGAVTDAKGSLLNKPSVTAVCDATCGNITLSGAQTIDGQACTVNVSTFLLTAQSTMSQNGPWVCQTSAWTRPTWYPSGGTTQALTGSTTLVRNGAIYGGSLWKMTTISAITIDTSAQTWAIVVNTINSNTANMANPPAIGATTPNSGAFTNLSATTPLPVTSGGNGLATATLGDLRYGSGPNTLAALAGSTSATKQFLTQTGNGTVSAAPAWGTIASGDLTSALAAPPAIGGTTAGAISCTICTSTNYFLATQAAPQYYWQQTGAGTNLGYWAAGVASGVWSLSTVTDALGAGKNVMTATRGTTTVITNVSFGNSSDNPSYTFNGSGSITSTFGAFFGTAFVASGSACSGSTYYTYHPTNALGVCSNGAAAASFTSSIDSMLGTTFTAPNATTVAFAGIAANTGAQTGYLCWASGGITYDATNTCLVSSERYKHDIVPLDEGLDALMRLRPVSYTLNEDMDPAHIGRQIGFVAEDVAQIDPRLTPLDSAGKPRAVEYAQMAALEVSAIQDQQREIARQQLEIYLLAAWCAGLTAYLVWRKR